MDAIAQQISKLASKVGQKGLGDYLYYVFGETSGYESGTYFRRVLAPKEYMLSHAVADQIAAWVKAGAVGTLGINDSELALKVSRKPFKQVRFHNCHSSMPPEAHSLTENPLYELLRRKRRQVRAAPEGALRLLLLGDSGSRLLNRIGRGGEFDPTGRAVSGRQIITQFLKDYADAVDAVMLIVPQRGDLMWQDRASQWRVGYMCPVGKQITLDAPLSRFFSHFPPPRLEGYQARSLFRQGRFSPAAHGWYLGRYMTTGDQMSVTISARGLLDLLAGRITEAQFRSMVTEDSKSKNIFLHWLNLGYTISGIEMLPREVDQEDDRIRLYFSDDPAARQLKLPSAEASSGE